MSTHYNVYCAEHADADPMFVRCLRNADDEIEQLAKAWRVLFATVRQRDRLERCNVSWLEQGPMSLRGVAMRDEFVREHGSCRLVMRSEYGDEQELQT